MLYREGVQQVLGKGTAHLPTWKNEEDECIKLKGHGAGDNETFFTLEVLGSCLEQTGC